MDSNTLTSGNYFHAPIADLSQGNHQRVPLMLYAFVVSLVLLPVSIFGLVHAIKSLPGPTYPIEMARVLNGRKFRMERNLRGSFTSIYAYRSDGQKVWKSSPKFNSDVDAMTDAELDRWFNSAAAEYFADRPDNLCNTENSSRPE